MSRLTQRNGDSYVHEEYMMTRGGSCTGVTRLRNQAIDKLGELEDIEEELGIDLITFSKALIKGIYTRKFGDYSGELLSFQKDCFVVGGGYDTYVYYFKDYGKTWALTKEELEK